MAGNWQGNARRDRLPADWPTTRPRILKRDGYRCRWVVGGVRCKARATDVDHILSNDDDHDYNLQSLCSYHHRMKTAGEGNAAKARLRAAGRRTPEAHPGRRG